MSGFAEAMAIHDLEFAQREANYALQQTIMDAVVQVNERAGNTAKEIAYVIYNEVTDFQQSLSATQDVAMLVASFGGITALLVDTIGYKGNSLIVFRGTDTLGKPQELIQHVSQLNFLLQVAPPPAVPTPPPAKRKIGFEAPP